MGENSGEEKPGPRGFSGLSSLISEVDRDEVKPPDGDKKHVAPAPRAPAPNRASPTPERRVDQRSSSPKPQPGRPPSTSSGFKWLVGIACVVGVVWWINESSNSSTTTSGGYQASPRPTAASPATRTAPSRPTEARPPVGDNNVLSITQLHYCLAEDIRLEGARSSVDNYDGAEVDRFNAMISDYNIRCGSFRYRVGDLERARRAVETFRAQYVSEGRNRF